MVIRAAVLYRYEKKDGTPTKQPAADGKVKSVIAQLQAYWTDPYSNLGVWKALNRSKSHPGVQTRRKLEPEGADD